MKKGILIILSILLIFIFTSCSNSKQVVVTTVAETIATETTIPETMVIDTATEITENKDNELFRNAIKDYDPISSGKSVEYAKTTYEIELEALEAMNSDNPITDEEKGTKFMDLAIKIQGDYLVFGVLKEKILDESGIQNITPDMIKAIDLINNWADTLQKRYEYTAKNYWGEGAEYEIKADELDQEANSIMDEYIALLGIMK